MPNKITPQPFNLSKNKTEVNSTSLHPTDTLRNKNHINVAIKNKKLGVDGITVTTLKSVADLIADLLPFIINK